MLLNNRRHCPICGQARWVSIYSESYSENGVRGYLNNHYKGRATADLSDCIYELVQCGRCSFTFQLYAPTDQLLAAIYDQWIPASSREEVWASHKLPYYAYLSEQTQFVIRHFSAAPNTLNVLDFGFGWGEFAKMAMAWGLNVTGCELSMERINYGRSVGLNVIDAGDLAAANYHFINTEQVFEHVVEPRRLLSLLAASLKRDGIIKISVPDSKRAINKIRATNDISALSRQDVMAIAPLEHINSFEHASLVALGKAVGLVPLMPNMLNMLNSSSGWFDKSMVKLFARPFYRHVFPKTTFIYFVHANNSRSEDI